MLVKDGQNVLSIAMLKNWSNTAPVPILKT